MPTFSIFIYFGPKNEILNLDLKKLLCIHIFFALHSPKHDEVEHNLKKILHRNGILGLEAIVMQSFSERRSIERRSERALILAERERERNSKAQG